ncbi:hypothetical protein [Faecalispora jeddahensis]|uniref:hypothetical protein n=1 Tax=Faecalispora jeddahensis TaxID=1414721 RepID=UPI00145B6EF0|nr:hypothetical protein [Faecalispora jeddahensis]
MKNNWKINSATKENNKKAPQTISIVLPNLVSQAFFNPTFIIVINHNMEEIIIEISTAGLRDKQILYSCIVLLNNTRV